MPLEQTTRPHALSQAEIQEAERLEALDRLDAIDAPRDEAFDGIARLVKNIFDVPIAIVSVLDAHRQLYKASLGIEAEEQERRTTFCSHAILSEHPTVVADATIDAIDTYKVQALGAMSRTVDALESQVDRAKTALARSSRND